MLMDAVMIFRRKMLARRHLGYQFFHPDDHILYLVCGAMERKLIEKEQTILDHVPIDGAIWTLTRAVYTDGTDGLQFYMAFGRFNRRVLSCSVLSLTELYRLYLDILKEYDTTTPGSASLCMHELLKYLFAPLNMSAYRLFISHIADVAREESTRGVLHVSGNEL